MYKLKYLLTLWLIAAVAPLWATDDGNYDNLTVSATARVGTLLYADSVSQTIVGGEMSPTVAVVAVEGEGLAADTLTAIHVRTGALSIYAYDATHTITVAHGTGAGEIMTSDGQPATLSPYGLAYLYRETTSDPWRMLAGGGGGADGADGADGTDGTFIASFAGEWTTGSYNRGDIVTYTGSSWLATPAVSTEETPGVLASDWSQIAAAGATGEAGAAGADGTDGNTWVSGAGAPGDGTGLDGDFYLDTTASAWYGPKAAGTWTATGPNSLIGPQGEQGIQGDPGLDGMPGLDGAAGADGADGADGVDGVNGLVEYSNETVDAYAYGMRAFYPLDEESGTRYDLASAGYLADVNTVGWTSGMHDNAALFTASNSEYLLGTRPIRSTATKVSISLWVKFTTLPADATSVHLINIAPGAIYTSIAIYAYTTGGATNLRFNVGTAGPVDSYISDGATVVAGAWYHVGLYVDLDAGVATGYVNGASSGTPSSPSGTFYVGSTHMTLGGAYYGAVASDFLDGAIDAVDIREGIAFADGTAQDLFFSTLYNSATGRFPSLVVDGLLPAGGTAGQKLVKSSSTDYDAAWTDDTGGSVTATDVAFTPTAPLTATNVQAALIETLSTYGTATGWTEYPAVNYTAIPFGVASMTMTSTTGIEVGMGIRWKQSGLNGGAYCYAMVASVATNSNITTFGVRFSAGVAVTNLAFSKRVTVERFFVPGDYDAGTGVLGYQSQWLRKSMAVVYVRVAHGTPDTGASQPVVELRKSARTNVLGTTQITMSGTGYTFVPASNFTTPWDAQISPTSSQIYFYVATPGTNGNAENFVGEVYMVEM